MKPRYVITLTNFQRKRLETLMRNRKAKVSQFIRARILILSDQSEKGVGWKVSQVAKALGVTSRTVEHLKRRFFSDGLEAALERCSNKSKRRKTKFDAGFEARLIALACSPAPEGCRRWTMRLLAEKIVELEIANSVSPMTIYRVLKREKCKRKRDGIIRKMQRKQGNFDTKI
jgi:transposase